MVVGYTIGGVVLKFNFHQFNFHQRNLEDPFAIDLQGGWERVETLIGPKH